jgi:DNA-binding MarR family transcriptional regulator
MRTAQKIDGIDDGSMMPTTHRQDLAGAGPALFRLVRFWSRRWVAVDSDNDSEPHVMHVLVLEAIDAAASGGPVSVADVANQLGIDRSGASRMVADAVESGHVRKAASPADARRAALAITDRGADLLTAARAWQERVFEDLVAQWPRRDAARLAGYLRRLADETQHARSEARPR